ncbi:MAG: excinuclease ABC subunit UvrC [Patescibacteria group bacterium]|nr:excinuclease ABC subunit UvrC [Patescibacteria group bacterium]
MPKLKKSDQKKIDKKICIPKQVQSDIKNLPANPGVYRFFDKNKNIIYIGKAKNLRNRVKNYFHDNRISNSAWTHKMVPQIVKIEWTVVNSEVEALLLESTLIKEHKPKYNIVLKDDKNYNFVRIDIKSDFPRIETTRKRIDDQAKYFGPFTDGLKLKHSLELLQKIFKIRTCVSEFQEIKPGQVKAIGKHSQFPCLLRSINRCSAPCVGAISKIEYHETVKKIILFFEGKYDAVASDLQTKIQNLASNHEFEKAAIARDQLLAIQKITEQQRVILKEFIDEDVCGFAKNSEDSKNFGTKKLRCAMTLLQIRGGKLIDQKNFIFEGEGEFDSERFLAEYYQVANSCPKVILLPSSLWSSDGSTSDLLQSIGEFLHKKYQEKVMILSAQKGDKKRLLDLADKNARDFLSRHEIDFEEFAIDKNEKQTSSETLAEILNSKTSIRTIEGFDISHLGGTETVASCVRFADGKPDTDKYRRFILRIIQSGEINDYKSMSEVLERRLLGLKHELDEYKLENNFIFIHGFLRTDKVKDPLAWLNQNLSNQNNFYQKLPNPDKPNLSEQIDFILKNSKITKNTTIVTHSIGGIVALKMIESNKLHIKRLVLIAPPLQTKKCADHKERHELANFHDGKFNFQKLKKLVKEIIIFQDTKDPIVFQKEPEKIAEKLDAKLIKMEAPQTHFNCDECAEILEAICEQVEKDCQSFSENLFPNLILIDGGKGQLNIADKVLKEQKLNDRICLLGLAKKNEEIFLPSKSKPVVLNKDNPALKLLMQVRDEAHRFAITHQKTRRNKFVNRTKLEDIPGIGAETRKKLVRVFGSTMAVRDASLEEVAMVVGEKMARRIKESGF